MEKYSILRFENQDIKLHIGNYTINVFYISCEPPVPSWSYKSHRHSTYELHFIPCGLGVLKVSQQDYEIKPGTFYLTGPGIFHEQTADLKNPMCEYCINLEIKLSKRKPAKSDIFIEAEVQQIIDIFNQTHFWIGNDEFNSIDILNKIFVEFENKWVGYYTSVQNYLSQIIINSARSFTVQKNSTYDVPKKNLNDSRRFIVDNYMKEFYKPLSKEALAIRLGVSLRQLERIFQKYYGMSFSENLRFIRMEQAKDMLRNTTLSIKEIAEKTNFSHAGNFCKVFQNSEGISPSAFRDKNLFILP